MSAGKGSLFAEAFRAWRKQPRIWMWMTVAGLPLVFSRALLFSNASVSPLMSIAAEIITFLLFFQFWFLAVLAYDMEAGIAWLDVLALWRLTISDNARYFFRLPLRFWLYSYLYRLVFFLPIMIILIVITARSSSAFWQDFDQAKYVLLAVFLLADFLSCFLLVRIFMAPQLAMLVGSDEETGAKATMEESITEVKEDYRRALGLFLLPWFVADAGMFLFGWCLRGLTLDGITAMASLLFLALLEGARTSFVIAGFNQFFSERFRDASIPQTG